jgi:hypothetical protein
MHQELATTFKRRAIGILRRLHRLVEFKQRLRFLIELGILAIENRTNPRFFVREEVIWSLDEQLHYDIFRETINRLSEHDNWIYFAGPIWFRNRISHLGGLYHSVFVQRLTETGVVQEWFPFLYPPNLATIDFLLRVKRDPRQGVLDYGCGIGGLGVYLSHLGFPIWLYDNSSQLAYAVLQQFWSSFGLQAQLIEKWKTVKDLPIFAVNCVGNHLAHANLIDILNNQSIEYLLLDTDGHNPFDVPGFRLHGYYPGLIFVLKRERACA